MKKLLLTIGILVMGLSTMAQENKDEQHLYLKVGANLLSGYSKKFEDNSTGKKVNLSNGKTTGFGYSLKVETTHNINENIELGLGIAYQKHNKFKSHSLDVNGEKINSVLGKYDSVPIYFIGKYNFNTNTEWKPFVEGNLGYSFNINEKNTKFTSGNDTMIAKTKVDNGLYLGVGAGIERNNFLVDLNYTINYGKAKITSNDKKQNTSKKTLAFGALTLSIGYKFDM